jgi:hypothetical protein
MERVIRMEVNINVAKTLKNGRKKRTVTLTVSDMDYHFGVKRVMFPSSAQKKIIKQNH